MALTLPHDFSTVTSVTGAELQAQFDAIVDKFNAAITTSDVSSSAGILRSQIEASYEHMVVPLMVSTAEAGGWPGGNAIMATIRVPGISGLSSTPWQATERVYWVCSDTGGGTGTFTVNWGEFDATGNWSNVTTVSAAGTIANANAADDANDGNIALTSSTVTLSVGTGTRFLALLSTGADATTLTGGNNYDFFCATVYLRRQITAS